jgi:hypothetical protein
MPTSLIRPNGHRNPQSSRYVYHAVLAVKGSGVRIPSAPLLRPEPRHLSSYRSGGVFCVWCRSCRPDLSGSCAGQVEQIWSTASVAANGVTVCSRPRAQYAPVRRLSVTVGDRLQGRRRGRTWWIGGSSRGHHRGGEGLLQSPHVVCISVDLPAGGAVGC